MTPKKSGQNSSSECLKGENFWNEEVRSKKKEILFFILHSYIFILYHMMNKKDSGTLQYSIWDPTGNITALVEGEVSVEDQPNVAAEIMKLHPEVEQVGYVQFYPDDPGIQVDLRMAGGEFCGNASMCAAARYVQKYISLEIQFPIPVKLRVSGASVPIFSLIEAKSTSAVNSIVKIPEALRIRKTELSFLNLKCKLPLVQMGGISHIIITPDSVFYSLWEDHKNAENAVKAWCSELNADCLGLMFLNRTETDCKLTPLVYVPGCNTTFWEKSCASGTAAVGMYLAAESGAPVSLVVQEPGGSIRVDSKKAEAKTFLNEKICFLGRYSL